MKQSPILYKPEMILALLANRKFNTRRLIKPQPVCETDGTWSFGENLIKFTGYLEIHCLIKALLKMCPYGQTGDLLWVRENIDIIDAGVSNFAGYSDCFKVIYKADNHEEWIHTTFEKRPKTIGNKPSIHMHKWASRLTQVLQEVRVERLQDITAEDAIAEGLRKITKDGGKTWKYGIPDRDGLPGNDNLGWNWPDWQVDPVNAYRKLWDSINGKTHPWKSNPLVWVLKTDTHQMHIDDFIKEHINGNRNAAGNPGGDTAIHTR